jgi:predicted RNase H-like nuclease
MPAAPLPTESTNAAGRVAGADGCREGWVVVASDEASGTVRRSVVDSDALLAAGVESAERADVLALDMVIGLPEEAVSGGRACDRAARQVLGGTRGRSVFSPPARSALRATSYDDAQRLQKASGPEAPGLSIQAYHLFPKLRAVQRHVGPERQDRIVEVHPELSFYAMNGDAPMQASKHTPEGRAARVACLQAAGFDDIEAAVRGLTGSGVSADDVLDAHAACWSARRIQAGEARRLPPAGEEAPRNTAGLRMEIWW